MCLLHMQKRTRYTSYENLSKRPGSSLWEAEAGDELKGSQNYTVYVSK